MKRLPPIVKSADRSYKNRFSKKGVKTELVAEAGVMEEGATTQPTLVYRDHIFVVSLPKIAVFVFTEPKRYRFILLLFYPPGSEVEHSKA